MDNKAGIESMAGMKANDIKALWPTFFLFCYILTKLWGEMLKM